MKYLKEKHSRNECHESFAADLAALSGADQIYMGFFDRTDRASTNCWTGASPGVARISLAALDADICQILNGLYADAAGHERINNRVQIGGYHIGLGTAVGTQVPVIAIRGGRPGVAADQMAKTVKLGLSYVSQQLSNMPSNATVTMGEAIETALNVLSVNLAVVDAYGEIDYATDFSAEWLEEYGGFEINLRRFSGKTQKLQKRLHKALALATGPARQPSIVPVDMEKRLSRIAVVMPLEKSNPPRALVILEQGKKDPELGDHMLKLSGLTNSECRIAHHLLDGKSVNEIADITNLSLSTVRSYLKGIFAKTRTHRQGQFITYFHNTVPRMKYIPLADERGSKPVR